MAQPPPWLLGKGRARLLPAAAVLLFVVGVLAQSAESLTIEQTAEWQACVANPAGCTYLVLGDRGLTGSIPASIGDFVNLVAVCVLLCSKPIFVHDS